MTCWALATGASRGVGFELARGLARAGCNLIISSRTPERLEEARALLEREGARVETVPADLRVEQDVRKLVSRALELSNCHLRLVALSYGNPTCEPCTLESAPWSSWLEAASMYLASTATILRLIAQGNRSRATVAAVTSFTVEEPHQPLIVADAVRRGLPAILSRAAHLWPRKIQAVLLVLGSFPTPGARETVGLIASGEDLGLGEYWKRNVEAISPLGRAGRPWELWRVAELLLGLPEYVLYTSLRVDGGSGRCLCQG